MIPVGKLKSNLQFNKNLGDLVEVMKLAATSQFNQFRLKAEPSLEFIRLLDGLFAELSGAAGIENSLFAVRDDLPALLVLVSSDEGFLGELNFLLVNSLLDARRKDDIIACTGKQGANYLEEINVEFSFFDSPGEKIEAKALAGLRDYILGQYLNKKAGRVYIVYPKFISITIQQVETETLLPLPRDSESRKAVNTRLLVEPGFQPVLEGWIKSWLDFRLYQIFWSSKLSEYAARIMHLEGSVQELRRINSRLNMEYFKYLHGLSDKSIRELTAARILKENK